MTMPTRTSTPIPPIDSLQFRDLRGQAAVREAGCVHDQIDPASSVDSIRLRFAQADSHAVLVVERAGEITGYAGFAPSERTTA